MPTNSTDLLTRGDRLLNDVLTVTKEALQGVVSANPHLALLDIGTTIVRRDYADIQQIKILSGGPSGHEPLYSGYVGKGMLTAAVQGDIFCSPNTYDIVNTIKELAHMQNMGILIIIQNNSGDALNFGLAVEKAQTNKIKVKMLVVTDDCSDQSPSNKTDQARGLTGVLIMQKLAGAMAEMQEKTLPEMYNFCDELQKNLATVIITLRPCTSSSEATCICRKNAKYHEADIGGGMHGESGLKQIKISSSEYVAGELLKEISKNITYDVLTSFVLLINTMCLTKLEENIFIGDVVKKLHSFNILIARIYVGTFMTSLDMKGMTVTILKGNDEVISYLDYPTDAPSWNLRNIELDATLSVVIKPRIRVIKYPRIEAKGPKISEREANILLISLQFACDALISCERQLNIIDAESGDGDTGTRLKFVAEDILEGLRLKAINLENLYMFFKSLGKISDKIGGTMGALYGIIFEGACNVFINLDETQEVNANIWLSCLLYAIEALKSHTKIEEGFNNMLAPLIACAKVVEDALSLEGMTTIEAFGFGVAAAEDAVKKTKMPEKKHPDPGAHAASIWMRAVFEAVKFRSIY